MTRVSDFQYQLEVLLDYQKSISEVIDSGIAQDTLNYLETLEGVAEALIYLKADGKTIEILFPNERYTYQHGNFHQYLTSQTKAFKLSKSSEYFKLLPLPYYTLVPGRWKDQSTAFLLLAGEPKPKNEDLYSILSNEFARNISISQKLNGKRSNSKEKETEKRLKRLNAQLQVRNDAINQIAILSIANEEGKIIEVNEQFKKLTKYSEEEVIGKTYKLLQSGMHPPSFYENLWKTVKSGKIWRDEICNKDKHGNLIWMLKTIIPFQLNGNSKDRYYCSLSADISNQKEREAQLRIAKEEVEKAIKIKEDFLSIMSHELRTPLNAVIGISQLLQKIPSDEYQNKLINTLGISAKNLHHLINDILDYSKIEAGKVSIHKEPFNLRKSIENIKTSFDNYTVDKGLDFEVVIDANVPQWTNGDELRLGQVLNNLISNAIKYTAFGFVKIKVSRSVLNEKTEKLIFQIEDSGIGIRETELNIIFNAFEQVSRNQVNKSEGTGLGLSIVKNLVALMEGDIEVKSEYMKGTSFRIEIPFSIVNDTHLIPVAKEVYQEEINLEGKRILYVEDVYTNQFLMRSIFKNYHASCSIASDGFHALELCKTNAFDMILMDIHLPGIDGYETASKIRQLNPYKNVPIIAFTANTSDITKDAVAHSCLDDLLAKPVELKKLENLLRTYLLADFREVGLDLSFFRDAFSNNSVQLQNYLNLIAIDIQNFKENIHFLYENEDLKGIQDELHKIEPIVTKFRFNALLLAIDNFKKLETFNNQSQRAFDNLMEIASDFIRAIKTVEL